jgi:hypothetical protein
MKNLYELPTLNEIVGSAIAILAVAAIVYLAISDNPAAQTALVSVAGAAAGTYYASNKNGNGKPAGSANTRTEAEYNAALMAEPPRAEEPPKK